MTSEVQTGLAELMDVLRQTAKQAAEDAFLSGMVDIRTAEELADSVVFSVLCVLDDCAYEGHTYSLIRGDGLNLSCNGLHDHYFQRPKT